MNFYRSIADYYDLIFPYNPDQHRFISQHCPTPVTETHLLDIGCSTGQLTYELAKSGIVATGIDTDEAMITSANSRTGTKAQYLVANMTELASLFDPHNFHIVTCLGNTLVHLTNLNVIEKVLSDVHSLLMPRHGRLFLQIIHYDRILDNYIDFLPTIENDSIVFERKYIIHPSKKHIDFQTQLQIKNSGELIVNSIPLFPLRKNELKTLLKHAGFRQIQMFGNFKGEPLTQDSMPLIVIAS